MISRLKMFKFFYLFLILILYFFDSNNNVVNCANILAAFGAPVESHQKFLGLIWKELALRGHNVTVFAPKPINDPRIKNLKEIDLSFSFKMMEDLKVTQQAQNETSTVESLRKMALGFQNIVEKQLLHPEVQALLKDKNNHFDVVLVEFVPPALFYLSEYYDCPLIVLSSMPATPFTMNSIGNPVHPVVSPDNNLPFGKKLTLMQRATALFLQIWMVNAVYTKYYPLNNELVKKVFGVEVDLEEIEKRRNSLVISNVLPVIHNVRLKVPNLLEIHGIHLTPPAPLPQDLQEFLDGATEGAIYFSLGTFVVSEDDVKQKLEIFAQAFSELRYKIVWKLNNNDTKFDLKNAYIRPYFESQQDILRHPNVKCFITQGGLHSVEEAIAYHVPIVGVPFVGDQFSNVKKMVESGMGLELDFKESTNEKIKSTIQEVMENRKYFERVKEVEKFFFDKPMKPMDEIIWWIEYVIRHKGAYHLRSPYLDLTWNEYYHLDIIFIIITVASILIYVIYKSIRFVLRFFWKCKNGKKNKSE